MLFMKTKHKLHNCFPSTKVKPKQNKIKIDTKTLQYSFSCLQSADMKRISNTNASHNTIGIGFECMWPLLHWWNAQHNTTKGGISKSNNNNNRPTSKFKYNHIQKWHLTFVFCSHLWLHTYCVRTILSSTELRLCLMYLFLNFTRKSIPINN